MPTPTFQLEARAAPWIPQVLPALVVIFIYRFVVQEVAMMRANLGFGLIAVMATSPTCYGQVMSTIDLSWHAPSSTEINNLTDVIGGSGTYGFIFNSSNTPAHEYGTYNWCNMPHVRATEYTKASSEYQLQYVEVVSLPGKKL